MPKTIEQELLAITKVKKQKDRQKFLTNIVETINDLPEDNDDWDSLSAEAQTWFNTAVKAIKNDKDIPEPDAKVGREAAAETEEEEEKEEEVEEEEEEDAEVDEEEEEEEKPKKVAKKAKSPKVAKVKTPKPAAAAAPKKKAKSNAAPGAPTIIKQMILKKPAITKDELIEKLKAKGLKLSPLTVTTQRSDFRHSLKVLQEAGMLKKNLEL